MNLSLNKNGAFHIYAVIAAVGYAMAAVFSKQALTRGADILRFIGALLMCAGIAILFDPNPSSN